LSEDERQLWREWPNMSMATTSAALVHLFASEVIQPLLGKDHVDAGVNIYLLTIHYFHQTEPRIEYAI
jgi:inositol-pentakisphosphate 2-kinase